MAASTSVGPGRVFISYRRDDSAFPAGWLYDRLCAHLGSEQVFKDVDSIDPGDDFFGVIEDAVGSCQVLLALIGDRWLDITDETGNRRLDDPEDFVRLEIEAGLRRDVRVIPILVGRAPMPRSGQLPDSLRGLARRNAIELSPNRFESDLARLVRAIDKTLPAIGVGPTDAPADTSEVLQAPKAPVEEVPDQHGDSESNFGQRSPPITTGSEVAIKPGIPAPDDAEAAMVSIEEQPPAVGDESRVAAEATSSKVDTEPAEKRTDAQHSGSPAATQDRLTAFVVPVGTTSTPGKLRLLQRLSRRTKIVLAAGIVAIVVLAAGVIGFPQSPPPPPNSLDGLLLSVDQINTAMGTTGMSSVGTMTTLPDNDPSVSDQACLPLSAAAQAKVYAGSGYSAVRSQVVTKAQQNALDQAVVLFSSPQDAGSFFAASAQRWQACSNRQFTLTVQGISQVNTVGPVFNMDGTLSATVAPANSPVCERALTVADNVAIDVTACVGPPGSAVNIAHQIAAKVPVT
jgi:hypothetical protein